MRSFVWRTGLGLLFIVGCSSALPGNTKPGADAALACAGPGESCAASGCCGALSDACLQQGSDWRCVNAILPLADAGMTPFDGGGDCIVGLTSNLPGVALTFDAAPCSYSQAEIAAGIEIPYHEEIDSALERLHPVDDDGGRCQQPDAAGLIVSYDIAGGGQLYCVCDTGLCLSQSFTTSTTVGNYYHQIAWDGRNWSGPSDTGNPEGAPFPVGTYTVTLTATGSIDGVPNGMSAENFTLTATRTITITP
ncbi:MAG TPA: hypothetical protein VI456_14060 [Polyangia bacterium]